VRDIKIYEIENELQQYQIELEQAIEDLDYYSNYDNQVPTPELREQDIEHCEETILDCEKNIARLEKLLHQATKTEENE
jgi:hypothetical protein